MSCNPNVQPGSPHSWLAHAKSDLRITELCRVDRQVLPNQTAFHAQQAAEKAIKAVLVKHQIRFPRTHDLAALIALIERHSVVWPFAPDEVEELNPFAVQTRYPDETDQLTESELAEAIAVARRVVDWAEEQI